MKKCSHCGNFEVSSDQWETLEFVRKRVQTNSRDLAKGLKIGISNASNKLANLYGIGLLNRTKEKDSTGGVIYEYYRTNKLPDYMHTHRAIDMIMGRKRFKDC